MKTQDNKMLKIQQTFKNIQQHHPAEFTELMAWFGTLGGIFGFFLAHY